MVTPKASLKEHGHKTLKRLILKKFDIHSALKLLGILTLNSRILVKLEIQFCYMYINKIRAMLLFEYRLLNGKYHT
jgi:hypothetical protein